MKSDGTGTSGVHHQTRSPGRRISETPRLRDSETSSPINASLSLRSRATGHETQVKDFPKALNPSEVDTIMPRVNDLVTNQAGGLPLPTVLAGAGLGDDVGRVCLGVRTSPKDALTDETAFRPACGSYLFRTNQIGAMGAAGGCEWEREIDRCEGGRRCLG
jgi:hypothetical protein